MSDKYCLKGQPVRDGYYCPGISYEEARGERGHFHLARVGDESLTEVSVDWNLIRAVIKEARELAGDVLAENRNERVDELMARARDWDACARIADAELWNIDTDEKEEES